MSKIPPVPPQIDYIVGFVSVENLLGNNIKGSISIIGK
jgi:hypothetical protein